MALIKVSRNVFAYWQKARLALDHGKVVRQFLTEEERWKMGGKSEECFEAEYDPRADRWNLRSVARPPDDTPNR
jgi:hypothetical protein